MPNMMQGIKRDQSSPAQEPRYRLATSRATSWRSRCWFAQMVRTMAIPEVGNGVDVL